jgi:hypothetical protein
MPINSASNQFITPSSGGSGVGGTAGSSLIPGPTFFFIRLGVSLNGFGLAGSSIGGTVSIFGLNTNPTPPRGGGGGGGSSGGSGSGGSSGGTGGVKNPGGYGASFSSGYSFALGSLNNYGMFSTAGTPPTLGAVPVHTYGGGGDVVEAPPASGTVPVHSYGGGGDMESVPSDANSTGNVPLGNQDQKSWTAPYRGPVNRVQGPNVDFWNRSQGKHRGAAASLMNGPGQPNNP